jgi:hypothetical protein
VLACGLDNLEMWLDYQASLKRIRYFYVTNLHNFFPPYADGVSKKDMKSFKLFWKDGQVHMTSTGYEKLAQILYGQPPRSHL